MEKYSFNLFKKKKMETLRIEIGLILTKTKTL